MEYEYRLAHDPAEFPHSSTAFEGYLWVVELEPGVAALTDSDDIAAYEIEKGRDVSIMFFDEYPG